jgi:S1-C subfamily serine protease
MITEIVAGGPADRPGLRAGDVLFRWEAAAVTGVDDLHRH